MKALESLAVNYILGDTKENYYLPESKKPVMVTFKNKILHQLTIYDFDKTTKVLETDKTFNEETLYFKYQGGKWSYSSADSLKYHDNITHSVEYIVFKYPDIRMRKATYVSTLMPAPKKNLRTVLHIPSYLYPQYAYVYITFDYHRGSVRKKIKLNSKLLDIYDYKVKPPRDFVSLSPAIFKFENRDVSPGSTASGAASSRTSFGSNMKGFMNALSWVTGKNKGLKESLNNGFIKSPSGGAPIGSSRYSGRYVFYWQKSGIYLLVQNEFTVHTVIGTGAGSSDFYLRDITVTFTTNPDYPIK